MKNRQTSKRHNQSNNGIAKVTVIEQTTILFIYPVEFSEITYRHRSFKVLKIQPLASAYVYFSLRKKDSGRFQDFMKNSGKFELVNHLDYPYTESQTDKLAGEVRNLFDGFLNEQYRERHGLVIHCMERSQESFLDNNIGEE